MSDGIWTCARCDKPILPEEEAVPIDKFSASGAGIIGHVHARCPRPSTQTAPVSRDGLIRD